MNNTNKDNLSKKDKQALLAKLLEDKKNSKQVDASVSGAMNDSNNGLPTIERRSQGGDLSLSFSQKRLWMIDRIDGGSLPYIMSAALRLHGELNISCLKDALTLILKRNEVLRTQYKFSGSELPIQHIVENAELSFIHHMELDGLANFDSIAEKHRREELNDKFDLEHDVPFRARLLEFGQQEYLLILTTHHIAADGWSIAVINEQLSEFYADLVEGRKVIEQTEALQYADYALWQNENEKQIVSAQLPYWREKLSGAPLKCTFPADFKRPETSSYIGENVHQLLGEKHFEAITQLSQRYRVSIFMVLHSLLACLLQRFTGEKNIIIGTPVANREQAEVSSMIGFFVNSLPLSLDLSEPFSFADVLSQSRDCVLQAFTHQQLPFERLVDELNTDRATNINPIFQVALAYNNNESKALSLPGLNIEQLPGKTITSKFDLTLNIEDVKVSGRKTLEFNWEYATDLYTQQTILTLSQYFTLLLETVAEHSDTVFEKLPLLINQHLQLIEDVNNTRKVIPTKDIWSLFEDQVDMHPDKIAIWQQKGALTYTYIDLKRRVEFLSSTLAEKIPHHKTSDIVVGILSDRSASAVVAMLAVVRLGYAYLPLDPKYPEERIKSIIVDSECQLILVENESLLNSMPEASKDRVMLLNDESNFSNYSGTVPASNVSQNQLAYIMYTSGTTGTPKGVMVEQQCITRLVSNIDYAPIVHDDKILLTGSLTFDATTYEIWGSLLHGCTLSVVDEDVLLDSELLGDALAEREISTLWLTSPLFNQHAQYRPEVFSGLKQLIVGGDALSVKHIQLVRRANPDLYIVNGYGPTENTTFSICNRISPDIRLDNLHAIPIGKPISNSTGYVVNSEGNLLPIGVPGELLVGGKGVARGYLNREDLTHEKFVRVDELPFQTGQSETLYRTGDLVCLNKDGLIEFLGRLDDQVKIRGFRVELGEIQTVLRKHVEVEQAHVVVRQDKQGHKQIIAYLALGKELNVHDSDVFKQNVSNFVTEHLPDYMLPGAFVLVEKMPLNKNGKIDQHYLPEPEFSLLKATERVKPENNTETVLLSIWEELLGVRNIGVADNFFAIGGDSILAIQVISRAREQGMKLSVKSLFKAKTIRNLAKQVVTASSEDTSESVVGSQRLLPIQQLFFNTCNKGINHFNQHVMLQLDNSISTDQLTGALEWLVEKHDVMRLVFTNDANEWQANYATVSPSRLATRIEKHDARDLVGDDLARHCLSVANHAQASLDIEKGDTFRWVLIRTNEEIRLLWVMHHLIVDGVSWRILIRDLERYLSQEPGKEPGIVKTKSYQSWAKQLHDMSQDERFAAEAGHWIEQAQVKNASLDFIDYSILDIQEKHTRQFEVVFSAQTTEALLKNSNAAYSTQINDLLLSALLLSLEPHLGLKDQSASRNISIDLEGHGREDMGEEADITETVGWFTSIWPVNFSSQSGDLAKTIKHTKEALAAVPNNGMGYGMLAWRNSESAEPVRYNSPVVFNYLGQLDRHSSGESPIKGFTLENCGNPIGEEINRSHPLRVTGMIKDNSLQFVFDYNELQIEADTVKELSIKFRSSLEEVVTHCQSAEPQRTPSDYPLLDITQDDLDILLHKHQEIENIYPATGMQQSLLFQSIKEQNAEGVYVTQLVFAFESTDAVLMHKTWQKISDRHEIFRTLFLDIDSASPLQVVLEHADIDWREMVLENSEASSLQQLIDHERSVGFELSNKPLQKFLWLEGNSVSHLVWTHHHALIDGWCLSILLEELLNIYMALQRGSAEQLPAVKPYNEYISWLNKLDKSDAESYWEGYLGGVNSSTRLGVESLSQSGKNTQLEEEINLDEELTYDLKILAKKHSVTLNTVFQSAWGLLLSKYSGEDDLLFGTTVSGRPAELDGSGEMVGLFINTLPVRYTFDNMNVGLGDWFQSVHDNTLKANDYAYLSLGEIQLMSGVPNNQTMFESVLVFENYPLDLKKLNSREPGQPQIINVEGIERSDLPLNLVIYPGDQIKIKLAFRSDMYSSEKIIPVLQHYKNILASFCHSDSRTVSDVRMLSRAEINRAIGPWNDTDMSYMSEVSLYDAFHVRSQEHGKQAALVFGGEQTSYEELDRRVDNIALALQKRGVSHGDRVIVSLQRGTELVASLLAVMKLGAVYVPVALDCPKERLEFIVKDANAYFAVIQQDGNSNIQSTAMKTVVVDDLPRHATSFVESSRKVASSDEAYVIYTSGTTGRPKGVSIAHKSLVNLCQSFSNEGWLEPGKASLQFAPFTFDASMAEIFVGLLNSATVHIASDNVINDPPAMQEYLNKHDVRFAAFPPQYLQHLDVEDTNRNLQVLTAGSAPTVSQVKAWSANHSYINAYGPTETTVLSSAWQSRSAEFESGTISIGKPLANTQIYVVDHFGQLCAPGQKGEIYIGGDGVALGYLNNSELNKKHFTNNPWKDNSRVYKTGDLGRWLENGDIEYIGRYDDQVKIRGFRIEPDEIVRCCMQVDDVEQCAVMARPDPFGDLMLVAYVSSSQSQDMLIDRLRTHVTESLPSYMMPSHIVVLPELPMTGNGKIDRNELEKIKIEKVSTESDHSSDASEQEEQLLQIWRQYLSNDSLQVNDDFFEFGGNSILLMRMMKPMKTAGFDIPVNEMYQRRTVRKCCELFSHSIESLIDSWKSRDIQFEIVTNLERGARTDFWLLQEGQDYGERELKQFFANMDGASLPDYVRFVPDLNKARFLFTENGKHALSGWKRPYTKSIRGELDNMLESFHTQYVSSPVSSTIPFTPMQESMTEWDERSVFELVSIYGWYSEEELKDSFRGLVADQELLRSVNHKDRRWGVIEIDDFNVEIPYLDIRFLDDYSQNRFILAVASHLQAWQKANGLPYVACWVTVSDTKHYFLMLNDHLISDESSSLAIKSKLNQILQKKPMESGRNFSDYALHLRHNISQNNVDFVRQRIDIENIIEVKQATEEVLSTRKKLPIRRMLIRVPLEKKKSALDQSFLIFRKIAAQILDQKEFCMVMNHFGRQIEGQNDFHQVGLFLDKIPFVVNERTRLEDINVVVDELGEKGISFVGLAEHSMLGGTECLPSLSNEVLFNYQGDQQKDPMVQQWFSQLDLKKALKKFNGIVFEARQLDRELSVHCIFRGKKNDPDDLIKLIEGARFADRMVDSKYYNVTYWQRIKSVARDPLYGQLKSDGEVFNAIDVENVKKAYGDFQAVKGVSFSVERGKCFGILGPNGAGKTTLLSMMEGINSIDSGTIKLLNMDVQTELKNIQPHIGVQLQQNNYFQFLNVEEMLLFYRDLRTAVSGKSKGQSIDELLDKLSLSDKRKSLVDELSGGQQQRLTIAIAMLNEPDIVFLDEPTSALDPQTRRYIWDYIEHLKESGDKTIIITTHYMEEAERLCDELIIMNEGQITAQGSPDQLIENLNAHYDISVLLGKGDVDDSVIHSFSGVTNLHWGVSRREFTISTTESAKTLKELFAYIEESEIELLQFHIDRPSLEDVFISNTGKELRE